MVNRKNYKGYMRLNTYDCLNCQVHVHVLVSKLSGAKAKLRCFSNFEILKVTSARKLLFTIL